VPKKTRGQGTKKPKAKTTTPGKNVSGGTRGQKNIKKVTPTPPTNNKPTSRVAGRVKGGPKVVATAKLEKTKNKFKRGPRNK
jgi:hypothetical protein